MVRPSRNTDALLLAAGRELFPEAGVRGLSVRKVAERAGVNLGMFHYHFKSKDAFIRVLLQQMYDGMFGDLELAATRSAPPVATLRRALLVLARFVRDHRAHLRRIITDALANEPIALDFLQANFPRHVRVIVGLIAAGQQAGQLKPVALPQALGYVAGAVAAPIVIGTVFTEHPRTPAAIRLAFADAVLTDAALAERIDLVLAGLASPRKTRREKAA